ncbi:TPA: hypothetical protein ACIUI9_002869 [Salmonella enterica subsp. enterica serovar 13,23:b:-]
MAACLFFGHALIQPVRLFSVQIFFVNNKRFNNQMAVENKFKLNVIAASVLMGLSLSAVAAVEAPKTPATETTPTKPEVKTLAGLTPPESAAKVSVTVKDFNGNAATTLEKILDDKTEGSVANLRKSYTDAKGVYDKLSPAQQKIITDLNTAASDKNKKLRRGIISVISSVPLIQFILKI